MGGGIRDGQLTNELVLVVHIEVVLVPVVTYTVLLGPTVSFWWRLAGFPSQPVGSSPSLIAAFSSRVFRWRGTGAILASMI